MDMRQSGATFPETMWSLVACAEDADHPRSARARETLARVYWSAVYAFLRRSGRSRDEAEELTQAFFADVVSGRALLARASPERGRLRTLMIAAVKNYQIDVHRYEEARRIGKAWSLSSMDVELEEQRGPAHADESPDVRFDREWAASVVNEALCRCRRHFEDAEKQAHWKLFEARVVRPLTSPSDAPPLAGMAQALGFGSAADAAAAVQVVKKRFDVILREVTAETTAPGEEAEDEWRWLHRILG